MDTEIVTGVPTTRTLPTQKPGQQLPWQQPWSTGSHRERSRGAPRASRLYLNSQHNSDLQILLRRTERHNPHGRRLAPRAVALELARGFVWIADLKGLAQ